MDMKLRKAASGQCLYVQRILAPQTQCLMRWKSATLHVPQVWLHLLLNGYAREINSSELNHCNIVTLVVLLHALFSFLGIKFDLQ